MGRAQPLERAPGRGRIAARTKLLEPANVLREAIAPTFAALDFSL